MPRDEIFKEVVRALLELQEESGREGAKITGAFRPIGDLAGFDSHAGLEFTCAIEMNLKIEIPLDENLCVDDEERRAKSVDEIVDRLVVLEKGE